MFFNKFSKKWILGICFAVNLYACEYVEEQIQQLVLGRSVPAYFKIMSFDKTKWERFADTFSAHPVAEAIKQHLESIELSSLVFSKDEIFATEYFKAKMRQAYCQLFNGARPSAPLLQTVDSDGMYAGILGGLTDSIDVEKFEEWIAQEMDSYQKIMTTYNNRLQSNRGNSALLKHFLGKIFFAPNAYTDPLLTRMRMTLLAEDLVAGDDHLFALERDITHTLAESILKCLALKGAADTLVIGCGDSLIGDVADTSDYLACDFLYEYTRKTFVHDCQHCLADHSQHISVALTEAGLGANTSYDGAAHADIFADAKNPQFWAALKRLKDEGRSPIRRIIDHAFMLNTEGQLIADCLDSGGEFITYLSECDVSFEQYGFSLNQTRIVTSERTERIYIRN